MANDSSPRTVRPLISARDKSVGGAVMDTEQFRANPDLTFIPGYSDKRRQIDYELGKGWEPTVQLSHRFQWITVSRLNGSPTRQKVMQFQGQRYKRATKDFLLTNGYDMPLAADETSDGGIRLGDAELYFCTAEVAAHNESLLHHASQSQTADDSTASDLHSAGREIDRTGNLTTAATTHEVKVSPR